MTNEEGETTVDIEEFEMEDLHADSPTLLQRLRIIATTDRNKRLLLAILIGILVLNNLAFFWFGFGLGRINKHECDSSNQHECPVITLPPCYNETHEVPIVVIIPEDKYDPDKFIDPEDYTHFDYHPLKSKKEETEEYIFHFSDEYVLNREDPTINLIAETNEYQLQLDPAKFVNREEGIHHLLSLIDSFLNSTLTQQTPIEEVWYEPQYHGSSSNCGASYNELRTRNYLTGKHAGTAESSCNKDLKRDQTPKYYFLPAVSHMKKSEWKLETDIHPCGHSKLNRKIKVSKLPMNQQLDCAKAREYFPQVFVNQWNSTLEGELSLRSNYTYYGSIIDGYLFNGTTKFKSSFNLIYKNAEQAISGEGTVQSLSEYSLRIYSLGDGYGPWDHQVLSTMSDFYIYMLNKYGSHKEYPCNPT